MRFGGLIAAAAWIVSIAGVAAQTPAQAPNSDQQANQPEQIHDPAAEAQKAQEKAEQANPANKKAPTAEEEREQKIRQYDPLADQGAQQPQGQNGQKQQGQNKKANGKGGSNKASDSTEKSEGSDAAAAEPPGPSVDGDTDNADDSSGAYSGPAVMSRSYTLLRPSIPSQERWIPILGLNAIYDSGLQGLPTATSGYTTGGSFGAEMLWGITGRHYFRHDIIGVDYRGDLQYYSPARYFDGSNHSLTLDYTHMFSRRLWLTLIEAGSVYSQNYTLVNPVTVTEQAATDLTTTPNVQIFNNGWKQVTTSADVTYQKSMRLSFNGGASGFVFKPESSYLVSSTGASARADTMYRVTRRTSLGVSYSYNNFWFPRGAGRSVFHTVNLVYSWALSRTMQVNAAVGASHLNSTGQLTEYIDPQLAALLGQGGAITQYSTVQWVSNYSAQFSKSFHRSRSVSVTFNRGLVPGNGLYLTSRQEDIGASGSMILFRHYYFSAGGGYDSLSAATQTLGEYRSMYAFFGASRALRHGIQANMRFDYRHYDVGNTPLLSNTFRITLGFTWSPVEGLHRLW